MSTFNKLATKYAKKAAEEMTLEEYLKDIHKHPERFASPAERILAAIGEPTLVDTSKDEKLSRLFGNRVIKTYEAFDDFYGLEEVIEKIVSFYKHAAQGLEESKQILYLLGPVGSAKSSLAERLKELMTQEPIYALKGSPIQESPLGLLSSGDAKTLKIPPHYLKFRPSPWAIKRLDEFGGDMSKFKVIKVYPDDSHRIAVATTTPADETNQDISDLVGKINIRQLEHFTQDDADAYNFSGGLCRANQGILDFVEMFKAPTQVLHPLLTATQEGKYNGTEEIGSIPFDGLIIAHSNESEWKQFIGDKKNEAFLDRVTVLKVPYVLRLDEEVKIYEKLIRNSTLGKAVCAPGTKEMLARFAICTRLEPHESSTLENKMKVYNGQRVADPKALSYRDFKTDAETPEGFEGLSTRDAYKILASVYNYDNKEIAANPVHMLLVLRKLIDEADINEDDKALGRKIIEEILRPNFFKQLGKDIQTAYLDSYSEFGQNLFERYVMNADHWIQDRDFRDPETGQLFDRAALNAALETVEKAAGISNPADFRHEVVNFVLRFRAKHKGQTPNWTDYERMKDVIEKNMFSKTEDLLPLISYGSKKTVDAGKKHTEFVKRMVEKGYTERQVRILVEWYQRNNMSV